MRRLILCAVLVVAVMTLLPGCLTKDARHNANHYQVLEAQARYLHESWDWFWMLDRPSMLHLSHDYWRVGDQP